MAEIASLRKYYVDKHSLEVFKTVEKKNNHFETFAKVELSGTPDLHVRFIHGHFARMSV